MSEVDAFNEVSKEWIKSLKNINFTKKWNQRNVMSVGNISKEELMDIPKKSVNPMYQSQQAFRIYNNDYIKKKLHPLRQFDGSTKDWITSPK